MSILSILQQEVQLQPPILQHSASQPVGREGCPLQSRILQYPPAGPASAPGVEAGQGFSQM